MENFHKVPKFHWLVLALALMWVGVAACGSQEGAREAAKEKAPPAAAAPATPGAGAATPKSAQDYVNQGKDLLKSKHYEEAFANFGEAINLDPKSIPAYNNRGIAYCEKGDFDKAIADFSKVIEIDPNHGKAYNNRAVAYLMKGDRNKARLDVEKAQSLGIAVNQMLIDSLKPEAATAAGPGVSTFPEPLPPGVTATPVKPGELPKPESPSKPEAKKH